MKDGKSKAEAMLSGYKKGGAVKRKPPMPAAPVMPPAAMPAPQGMPDDPMQSAKTGGRIKKK